MEQHLSILDRKPEIGLTPDIAKYFIGREIAVYQVNGDCLEGKRIPDQSYLFFDLDQRPSIGDVTTCRMDDSCILAKVFIAPALNRPGRHIVRTWYQDQARDRSLLVRDIQGVAVACFDDTGDLIWRRPTDEELKSRPSINTLEGWNMACKRSAAKMLIEKGIEPTEENIAKYQKDLKECSDRETNAWLARRKEVA